MTDIDAILTARGAVHGEFSDHARVTQNLKVQMRYSPNWDDLPDEHTEALEMIQHKIGRILVGDCNHKDHWDDIAGYAMLVSKLLK